MKSSLMQVNGMFAEINCPDALEGDDLHGLPPHAQVAAHVVDEYPACPKDWMHGSGKASSYFIGVDPGKGMWFDFTQNQGNEYEIAVVISVQGVNPLTGQKMTELRMEQYKNQCPLHKCDFQQDRFCPECGYKWPAQSYISTTTGQTLWLDGFRNEQGEVRQYIITEEEMKRGVAQQMIGEDRVWAIGFAFYRSKEKKPKPVYRARRMMTKSLGGGGAYAASAMKSLSFNSTADYDECDYALESCVPCSTEEGTRGVEEVRATKKLEVGAGARIDQEIGVDPKDIDYWEEEPIGLIYVNYVTPETVAKIVAEGKRQEAKDGFLNSVDVGN